MTIYRTSKGNFENHEEMEIFTKKYTANVGGKTFFTCDGQKHFGEPEPFPELVFKNIFETTNEELVLFFRSETQAEGFPKRNKKGNDTKIVLDEITVIAKPTLADLNYDQSFGFDSYRPDLYGTNKVIYKDKIATAETIENSFETDNQLSLEVKNSRGRSKFIDNEFKLVGSKPLGNQKYFVPNVLVMKGKTITFYAKYFCLQNTTVNAEITLSDATGIDNFTKNVTFSKSEEIKPITITTSATVDIPEKLTLSISVEKDGLKKVIGKCILFPNKEYTANFIFVDVTYNSAQSVPADYTTFIKNLNEKAFNQAGIIIEKSINQHSLKLNPSDCIRLNTGEDSDILSNILTKENKIIDFDKILEITCYKFYEKIALELISEIEVELKKVKVKDNKGRLYPLLKVNESLEDLIKSDEKDDDKQKVYNIFINSIISFIEKSKANYLIAFMCNLESADSMQAIGNLNARGLFVSKSGVNDYMTVAHEIGHNFNLGHTFVKVGQGHDLQVQMTDTLENVMDYLDTTTSPRKSFMSFQWIEMQKSLARFSNTSDQLDITSTTVVSYSNCLKDKESNYLKFSTPYLQIFSLKIILILFKDIEANNNMVLLDGAKDELAVLKIISEIIQKSINKLQS